MRERRPEACAICFDVKPFEFGDWLGRSLAWGLAALVACSGQVRRRDNPQSNANEAGQGSSDSGAAGGSVSGGGMSGTGVTLGGSVPVDPNEGGSTSVAGGGPGAVPLLDTTLCENDFVRVDQIPDGARFFAGRFDGNPVDVLQTADVAEPPPFHVFRFGPTHVEAISMQLYLADGPYEGTLQLSAADCSMYGDLFLRQPGGLRYYKLVSAELLTVTYSVDGFSGLTKGSVSATWINDEGEQHVLEAELALDALMGDARSQL